MNNALVLSVTTDTFFYFSFSSIIDGFLGHTLLAKVKGIVHPKMETLTFHIRNKKVNGDFNVQSVFIDWSG